MSGEFREEWDNSNAVSEVFFAIIDGQSTLTDIKKNLHEKKSHPTIIMHLRKLEKAGMVRSEKRGRERVYSVVWENVIIKFIDDIIASELNRSAIKELPGRKKRLSKLKKLENVHNNPLISGLIEAYIKGYACDVMAFYDKFSFSYCVNDFTWKLRMMKKEMDAITGDGRRGDKMLEELVEFLKYMTYEALYSHMTTDIENVEEYLKKVLK